MQEANEIVLKIATFIKANAGVQTTIEYKKLIFLSDEIMEHLRELYKK